MSASSSSSSTHWTCQTCTFAGNPSLYLACSVCNEPRQQQQEQQQQQQQQLNDTTNKTDNQNNNNNKKKPIADLKSEESSNSNNNNSSSTTSRKARKLDAVSKQTNKNTSKDDRKQAPKDENENNEEPPQDGDIAHRRPPSHSVSINNLSDRQYCCVWHVEVYPDAHRPDVARELLARIARHVNPILRARGWRVKRLMESCSRRFLGCCTHNGRADADAASTNIQLNLRIRPDKQCRQFFSFSQVLSVMLHEITHTSIGLEDIHPPCFYELLNEIKQQYRDCLRDGQVALEQDTYGCDENTVAPSGRVMTIAQAAKDHLGPDHVIGTATTGAAPGAAGVAFNNEDELQDGQEECGVSKRRNRNWTRRRRNHGASGSQKVKEKRRPLLKGAKMFDGRTKAGKAAKAAKESFTPRELAARAALARLGGRGNGGNGTTTAAAASGTTASSRRGGTTATTPWTSKATTRNKKNKNNHAKVKAAAVAANAVCTPWKKSNKKANSKQEAENAVASEQAKKKKKKSVSCFSDSDDDEKDDEDWVDSDYDDDTDKDDDDDDDDDDAMALHELDCPCRCCDWEKKFAVHFDDKTSKKKSPNDDGDGDDDDHDKSNPNRRGKKRNADEHAEPSLLPNITEHSL